MLNPIHMTSEPRPLTPEETKVLQDSQKQAQVIATDTFEESRTQAFLRNLPFYSPVYYSPITGLTYSVDGKVTPFQFNNTNGIQISNSLGRQTVWLNPLDFPVLVSVELLINEYLKPIYQGIQVNFTIFDSNDNLVGPSGSPSFPNYGVRIKALNQVAEFDASDLIRRILVMPDKRYLEGLFIWILKDAKVF